MSHEGFIPRENQQDVMRLGTSGERPSQSRETERRVLRNLARQDSVVAPPAAVPVLGNEDTATVEEKPSAGLTIAEETILAIVRDGLKHDRIDLFLQPIVKLPQRTRRFYECYSRIRAADGSMVLPAQFLGLARDYGLLDAIDNIVLFRCIQLVRKAQRHNHNLGFFCNISMQTLGDRKFFPQFIDFMAENRNLASRLTFDLAAEDVDSQWNEVADDLDRLARLGFRFSMDRVTHTGFDPELMARRHFKFVKVDVETLLDRSRDGGNHLRLLMREIDRNGIDLIVGKVETQAQLIELLDLGIYFAQGFLFGEPRPSRRG